VRAPDLVRTEIDRFWLAALEARGLRPVGPAPRARWLRRVTFDLTGLPPTPAEGDAFERDRAPGAEARVVDRLLASPRYGERWGRHWLDLVRYADTSGDNADFPIDEAYKYRDWVIASFNADRPYDEFVRAQLAGALLPVGPGGDEEARRRSGIVATGYLAIAKRFGSRADEHHLTIDDVIDNLGKTFLGLSLGCARCHDHKYDPVPQRDYFGLYGIFASTRFPMPGTEIFPAITDFTVLGTRAQAEEVRAREAEVAALARKVEALGQELKTLRPAGAQEPAAGARTAAVVRAEQLEARNKLERLVAKEDEYERAYAVSEGTPEDARVHRKGDPKALGDVAPRGWLQVLGGERVGPQDGSGRRALAGWLTSAENPLFARVMVNRIWQHHFGTGLVATPSDFGARGAPPTHPELLDFLAARFIEDGWSLKSMHRLIVLSRAYASDSVSSPAAVAVDPGNATLWRFSRRRLSAEELRDAMLAISGALDPSPPGAFAFPPRRDRKYTQHEPYVGQFRSLRRSVYALAQRGRRDPFFEVFDGNDANASTAVRGQSTTPLQALYLMNDASVHDLADRFAVRTALARRSDRDRIAHAYRLAFGRSPRAAERDEAVAYLQRAEATLAAAGVEAEARPRLALASWTRLLFSSNEFLHVD
jgi:hypothetical protein